ncbi:MAG: hypothetical protein KA764_01535 [Anaerolineales bacterium]|nr:hypothetical protein [Anaerolineales bacterium]
MPLVARGQALGLVRLPAADAPRLPALTVGETLGLALANLQLRVSLRERSIRDALTGLFNRGYREETLAQTGMGRAPGPAAERPALRL